MPNDLNNERDGFGFGMFIGLTWPFILIGLWTVKIDDRPKDYFWYGIITGLAAWVGLSIYLVKTINYV